MKAEEKAKEIFFASLEAVKPENFLKEALEFKNEILHVRDESYNLKNKKLHVFGSGKASYSMLKALDKILGKSIQDGIIVYYEEKENIGNVKVIAGSHPLPCEKSLNAGKKLREKFAKLENDNFYIYLLSGGSSAMIEDLEEDISLKDLQESTKLMLHNGLEIEKINTLRKKISSIKGGGLIKNTKAEGIVLVMSDVVGDDLSTIGSAPLFYKEEVKIDFLSQLLLNKFPLAVQKKLSQKAEINQVRNPKHYILASNFTVVQAVKQKALELGFTCKVCLSDIEGDVNEISKQICKDIENTKPLTCNIYGGESTLVVDGDGQGGRNQHLALLTYENLEEENITLLCAGTDGVDGNSPATGACITTSKRDKESLQVKKYLDNFDSYNFFKNRDKSIITGPTGINVMDICIVLRGESA